MAAIFRRTHAKQAQQLNELRRDIDQLRAEVLGRLQHVEQQITPMTEEIAVTRLKRFLAGMHRVVHLQIEQGVPATRAIAAGLQAVMAPLPPPPPGVAGGVARARHAWRYDNGTFMSYDDEEQILIEQHERMARGGRARARSAKRAPDGTFLPEQTA